MFGLCINRKVAYIIRNQRRGFYVIYILNVLLVMTSSSILIHNFVIQNHELSLLFENKSEASFKNKLKATS